jgi:hypothetical protein
MMPLNKAVSGRVWRKGDTTVTPARISPPPPPRQDAGPVDHRPVDESGVAVQQRVDEPATPREADDVRPPCRDARRDELGDEVRRHGA